MSSRLLQSSLLLPVWARILIIIIILPSTHLLAACKRERKEKDKSCRLERKVDGAVFEWVDFFGNGSSVSPKPNTAMNLEQGKMESIYSNTLPAQYEQLHAVLAVFKILLDVPFVGWTDVVVPEFGQYRY